MTLGPLVQECRSERNGGEGIPLFFCVTCIICICMILFCPGPLSVNLSPAFILDIQPSCHSVLVNAHVPPPMCC